MRRLLWLFPVLTCACAGDADLPQDKGADSGFVSEIPAGTPVTSSRCEGEFVEAGSMAQARVQPAAARLRDGRVIVAGGLSAETLEAVASVELFDPVSGSWSQAAAMRSPRVGHTLTVLSDGRVLAAGGSRVVEDDSAGWLASSELYDPVTNSWSPGPSLGRVRAQHEAALLVDGTVIVLGGHYGSSASIERLDPAQQAWTAAGELPFAAMGERIVSFPDGRALLINQHLGAFFDPVANAPGETYDVSSGPNAFDPPMFERLPSGKLLTSADSFSIVLELGVGASQTATPHAARVNASSAVLESGLTLVVGGETWRPQDVGGTPQLTAEVYEEGTERWRPAARMRTARATRPTVVALSDGRALVTGAGSSAAELYLPGSPEACSQPPPPPVWKRAAALTVPRVFAAGVQLPAGGVLVSGGISGSGTRDAVRSAELFDPVAGTWTAAGEMLQPRKGHALFVLPGGDVLAVGGGRADAERFNPARSEWSGLEPLPARPGVAVMLPDGEIVAAVSSPGTGLMVREPASGAWTHQAAGELIYGALVARGADELVAYARTVCAGPAEPCFYEEEYKGVVLRRDEAGSWNIATTDEAHRRYFAPTLVGLRNGDTLLLGGRQETTNELLLLRAGEVTWSPAAKLVERRGANVMSAELTSGDVFILGGYEGSEGHDNDWATTVDRFNRARGVSEIAESPFFDRFFGAVVVPLQDGAILLAGGQGVAASTASQVEIYRPSR